MAELIKPPFFTDVVQEGEKRLLTFLEIKLPENYYLIPNVEMISTNPRNHRTQYWEYDILVVAPHAIYNIENKDWRGRLEGDDNYWYLNDRQRPNPVKLNRLKTNILHTKLQEYRVAWGKIWVQNMVTLSHPYQNKTGLFGDASNITFLLDDDLIEFIITPDLSGVKENAFVDNQQEIAEFLAGAQTTKAPNEKKEVLIYEIIEILDREENYTEYLCKPKGVTSSIRMRVKEYALSIAGLSPEELRIREGQIKNQYKALNKIKVKNFFQSVKFDFDDENHYFYEITDFLDESTLRAELKKNTFTNEQRLNIISNLIAALKEAHKENIFHRDINPDNIFMYGGYAYLGNFGKAYFADHSEDGYTVMATLSELNVTPYHAFELLSKDASRASDIYSLGVLIYELFTGRVPVKSPFELDKLGGKLPDELLPTHVSPTAPKWLDELCNKTILVDDAQRFDNLEELENFIKKATKLDSVIVGVEETKPTSGPKDEFYELKIGDSIGMNTIQKELGKGGYSKVFKVQHGLQGKVYALKLFHESVSLNSVIDEYNALRELNHPNIVKFVWNDRFNAQFYTLMEYLDGEDMSMYLRGELNLPTSKVYQLAKEMLSALSAMQKQTPPLIHRDLKPQNIIWDNKKRFVLIDFNVASVFEANSDYVGTNPYIAPDLVQTNMKVFWDASADPFALGITLYQLTCKNHPWKTKIPSLSQSPVNPQEYNPKLSDEFAEFLFKSIQAKKENRFALADEMLEALIKIEETNLLKSDEPEKAGMVFKVDIEGKEVNFTDYLNSLYSQSKSGNAGTRAKLQSSAFDKLTYVNTKLDTTLLPSILDGEYKLVIITGNAGDGKTAFIKKIEEKAESGQRLENNNGASFKIKGVQYLSNYDGSQDEDEKVNEQVLEEFFAPFENVREFDSAGEGRIIAINEGRLADFLTKSGKHKTLEKTIENFFHEDGNTELPNGLLIINLNLRSVVASHLANGENSILRKQIQKIVSPELWKKCEKCQMSGKCFMQFNVQSLNDTSAGNEIIRRLEWLLRTISYKRELHITIRDLRSFVAWMITRDYRCDEVESLYEKSLDDIQSYWNLFYFNISAPLKNGTSNDRLIKLIQETDVASAAVPSVDRDLYFAPHKASAFISFEHRDIDIIEAFNQHKQVLPVYEQDVQSRELVKLMHRNFRRHHYFEGKKMFERRLPYQSVYNFFDLIINDSPEKINEATFGISKAIALNEGCDNLSAYSNYVLLSSTQTKDPNGNSYRRFPISDFELKVKKPLHLTKYLEYEPDSLTFRHRNPKHHHVKLTVTLDLYEMLDFIGKGFSPSLNDLRGRYIELQIFKNLLENLDYDEVIITKDNLEFYRISKQNGGKLKLETVNLN